MIHCTLATLARVSLQQHWNIQHFFNTSKNLKSLRKRYLQSFNVAVCKTGSRMVEEREI